MFGDRLKELRKRRGLTQEDLSNLLKISRGTYAHYEINKRIPDIFTVQTLADFFEVSCEYLIKGYTTDYGSPVWTDEWAKDLLDDLRQMEESIKNVPLTDDQKKQIFDGIKASYVDKLLENIQKGDH